MDSLMDIWIDGHSLDFEIICSEMCIVNINGEPSVILYHVEDLERLLENMEI